MSAPLKAIDGNADLPALMTELAAQARAAARVLALPRRSRRTARWKRCERAIRANAAAILAANAEDVAEVRNGGATAAFIDRLTLTPARIEAWPTVSRPCAGSPIRSAPSPRAGTGRTA